MAVLCPAILQIRLPMHRFQRQCLRRTTSVTTLTLVEQAIQILDPNSQLLGFCQHSLNELATLAEHRRQHLPVCCRVVLITVGVDHELGMLTRQSLPLLARLDQLAQMLSGPLFGQFDESGQTLGTHRGRVAVRLPDQVSAESHGHEAWPDRQPVSCRLADRPGGQAGRAGPAGHAW